VAGLAATAVCSKKSLIKTVANTSGCFINPISVLEKPKTSRYLISSEVV
jgi:hypothetical protein